LHFNVMHHSLILYGSCSSTTCEHKMSIETKNIKTEG
jgi:Fur family transcriptional regulator, ferric uptake regulator